MIDVTAVLNVHDEAILTGPSVLNFEATIGRARDAGLAVESLVVLDKPTPETVLQFEHAQARGHRIVMSDAGNLALARNVAVEHASGRFVGFLDADDLWSENWLAEAFAFCRSQKAVAAHSEFNLFFGKSPGTIVAHADSKDAAFDPDVLRVANYWDSLVFTSRETLQKHPYAPIDFVEGYGYEDWHWNCLTFAAGIHHRPVPGTVHFKRRRERSLTTESIDSDLLPRRTTLSAYSWAKRAPA
ncbi:MAG TPA: glycosyltransferase family A protein [Candidatus Acidoferrales bacterium]|jgi:glycosyltransferase involved in cell wall biosynthesis|nr:glycosyltransferase family A protein [Candidatus Acidoferrales bacterium]